MSRFTLRLIPALVLCLAAVLHAQDKTYDLKMDWRAIKGHRATTSDRSGQKVLVVVVQGGQTVNENKQDQALDFDYVSEVLETRADQVAKEKWSFTKAEQSDGALKTKFAFEGKTLTATYPESGMPSFVYEDGSALAPDDAAALVEHLVENEHKGKKDTSDFLKPKNPVKVGESWNPELMPMAESLGMPIDAAKSKGELKLARVDRRGDHDFGRIEGLIELAITQMAQVPFEKPVMMLIKVAMDVCIDGSLPDGDLEMSMEMKGAPNLVMPPGQPPTSMKIEMTSGGRKTVKSGG